jgi:medium-chain acyl-[acyl-carrier-protein] hydrolase
MPGGGATDTDHGHLGVTSRWVGNEDDSGGAGQLFCFAHAGGGSSFFRPWRAALAPEAAVRPIMLPGRESRLDEPPYRRLPDLVESLSEALQPCLDRPYALFGHSLGAVIAYEVARRLSASSGAGPAGLIVSGRRAPGLPCDQRRLSELPDEEFLAEVARLNGIPREVLSEPGFLSTLLPALRADYELAEMYQPFQGDRLDCPVVAYLSTSDPEADYAGMLAWREVTTGQFSIRIFRGDHFYLKGGRPDVLNAVREDLRLANLNPE